MNIGKINRLKVNRQVDFGVYLDSGDGREILLPAKYVAQGIQPGYEVDVFVYTDSEDRLIATTETPKAKVGEFAYLRVKDVNSIGAFLDWGITAKDLLVPFSEQKSRMRDDGIYLVYVYLDDTTKRIVASTKVEKYIGNVLPHYTKGDAADVLVIDRTPIGYRCIVDNLHYGMLYDNEIYQRVNIGDRLKAYVKNVREDCKIDLMLGDRADRRTEALATQILKALKDSGGKLRLSDKSDPEDIKAVFGCSKKDFKKAIGHLYKAHKIIIGPDGIKIPR